MREIKVTKHLADLEVDEDSDAVFTSEINYADEEAQWLLNDKVLFTNEVNTITHEGKVHKLTLKNLAPQDGGTITFQVRKVKESVTLKVKGKNCHALCVQADKKFCMNIRLRQEITGSSCVKCGHTLDESHYFLTG